MKCPISGKQTLALASIVTLAVGNLATVCQAQVMLQNGNSSVSINPNSQAGMYQWSIEGQNQLNQQAFWVGYGGIVVPISALSVANVTLIGNNEMISTYTSGAFNISIDYRLNGGATVGVGQTANSDISEQISIQNLTGSTLPLSFYQYSYFNLNGLSQDTATLSANHQGLFNDAYQSNPLGSYTETVVTPGANAGEVEPLGVTLAKLNSGGPVNLSNNTFSGPGAETWALQWNFQIGATNSALISADKSLDIVVVPEPSTFALAAIGTFGLAALRRHLKN